MDSICAPWGIGSLIYVGITGNLVRTLGGNFFTVNNCFYVDVHTENLVLLSLTTKSLK
jgi:hypothetical protein